MSFMSGGFDPVGPLFGKQFLKFAWIVIILTLIAFLILYKMDELPSKDEPLIDHIERPL